VAVIKAMIVETLIIASEFSPPAAYCSHIEVVGAVP